MTEDPVLLAFERQPLLFFSPSTALQAQALLRAGAEINRTILSYFENDERCAIIDCSKAISANDLFWLWTLGAYEVIRTMSQHKHCFSEELQNRIVTQKGPLATLRIPFSKQEYRGRPGTDPMSAFACGLNIREGIIFDVRGSRITSKGIISEFTTFVDGICLAEILEPLPRLETRHVGQKPQR